MNVTAQATAILRQLRTELTDLSGMADLPIDCSEALTRNGL